MFKLLSFYTYLRRKQIATVVLQLQLFTYCCLLLPIICIALVLRLGHTTGLQCERTQVRITPLTVVFIATAAAMIQS